ncbi:hypothetical protein FPSE_12397 [Fusarium pseudograminearum CS3096]|uniref:Uncharacterized protein n=1 Tax=Fusarium pseudograminearum (strain CS3096) TaxID=1028729 RepID=K3VWC9_FUSPC|nr:hypothetical protein FPSE_12397 [Fusarium pseudograminearum CS3096]EKJ67430.1 hypothetical protein FPSE_12397 [Fusarium pseudograminearum CS3096]
MANTDADCLLITIRPIRNGQVTHDAVVKAYYERQGTKIIEPRSRIGQKIAKAKDKVITEEPDRAAAEGDQAATAGGRSKVDSFHHALHLVLLGP